MAASPRNLMLRLCEDGYAVDATLRSKTVTPLMVDCVQLPPHLQGIPCIVCLASACPQQMRNPRHLQAVLVDEVNYAHDVSCCSSFWGLLHYLRQGRLKSGWAALGSCGWRHFDETLSVNLACS